MHASPSPQKQDPVIVIGAGPVGLVAAIDLAQRGVAVIVLERRETPDSTTVRCNHIASRTMETFRRMGFADEVRAAGFRDDFPHDVAVRTRATGPDIGRILIPGRQGRKTGAPGSDVGWPTVEPPHRMNQIFLEPVLHAVAQRTPGLTVVFGANVTAIEQTDGGIKVQVEMANGDKKQWDGVYLIGCDGGASMARKTIGAKLEGTAVIQHVQSTYIRAPGLTKRMKGGEAWGILNINLERSGTIYTIDNDDRFLVHNYVKPDETFDTVDRDACLRAILGVGPEFEYEVLRVEDWTGRRLMTDKMAQGRIFLAGDSAHLWVPMAGYGMNAGIADAAGLTWLMAAVIQGWAHPDILRAYEAERWPITDQVSHHAMRTAETMIKNRAAVPHNIEDDTPEGEAARQWYGQQTCELNTPQYACAGLNFGYYYDHSPIICYDDEQAPAYSMANYTPSTVPGCRFAHRVMADGSSIYDHFGKNYTLVRTRDDLGSSIERTAAEMGIPLTVLDIPLSELHPHALYLVRPDQHVAWRSNAEPSDASHLLKQLTGRSVH